MQTPPPALGVLQSAGSLCLALGELSPCFLPSGATYYVHDRAFNPDWVLPLREEPQVTSLAGGHCFGCSVRVRPATAAYLGFCHRAVIRWVRNGRPFPLRVECLSNASLARDSPEDALRRGEAWHFVAFDWFARHWQHHISNAGPTLGMALPLLRHVLSRGANVRTTAQI